MTRTLAAVVLLSLGAPASAHRLDEYLQATLLSVEKDRVQASMRLIPGVAVSPRVIWSIDTNGDGVLSPAEQQTYAKRVLGDLSLSLDGRRLQPRLVSFAFPRIDEMKAGLGEIHIEFTADLPRGSAHRRLILENYHQSRISAYLVNCLVPNDRNIQIMAQNRNQNQSFYQVNYVQAGASSDLLSFRWWSGVPALLATVALLMLVRFTFLWRQRAS